MAQDFTQQFVDNPRIGLVADMLIELGFEHPHGRFHIGPLMMVVKEGFTVIIEDVSDE